MDPQYSRVLEVAVTAVVGLTAGAMSYISILEVPICAKLSPREQLSRWRASFPSQMAFFKPAGIALVPALLCCAQVTETRLSAQLYCAAAVPFAMLAPFTILAIAPTNRALLESEVPSSPEAEEKVSNLVSLWGKRHAVRSVMVVSAFALAISACSYVKK